MAKIECGICDFNATMSDELALQDLYKEHNCLDDKSESKSKWYNSTGIMILGIAAITIAINLPSLFEVLNK